jgi:glycine cleavage system H protein
LRENALLSIVSLFFIKSGIKENENMRFTASHEWIHLDKTTGTVGITSYALKELGEIVFVELPKVGKNVKNGDEVCVLESTKAAVDIYTPVSGKIVEVNRELVSDLKRINQSPEKEGWLFKIQITDPKEYENLLYKEEYENLIS